MHPKLALLLGLAALSVAAPTPQLPMGMNVPGLAYWTPSPYLDPMKGAGEWMTFQATGGGPWDTEKIAGIAMRTDDYPTEIPQTVDGVAQTVRTMLNNCRAGDHVLLYQGTGTLHFNGGASARSENASTIVRFTGDCGHAWMDISQSSKADPVRNVRLIPVAYKSDPSQMPLFDSLFVEGLRPFHALRFMDWVNTNNSKQVSWNDRSKPTDRSYGSGKGMPIEHAVRLANAIGADGWFCVPHRADDNYITQFATMVRDSLAVGRKAYVEYSNEIWNWQFDQAHFVGKNGLEISWEGDTLFKAHDTLQTELRAVGQKYCSDPEAYCHPEKDAYMMDRTFRIWKKVFGASADTSRLVRVAAVQHAWYDNTGRILEYLFTDGQGADAVSPGGYFSFEERHHNAWNAMPVAQVTPKMILDSVSGVFEETSALWTRETARYAREYKVQLLVYEGGQHMQPFQQKVWGYNQAVWDVQIHSAMYDMYMQNFAVHTEDTVDCKLFMAFSYVGERESQYGSWGHLESLDQVMLTGAAMKAAAPKYAALLDANTPKSGTPTTKLHRPHQAQPLRLAPRPDGRYNLLGRVISIQ